MSYTEYLLYALVECAALRELTLRYRRIDTISPPTRTHNMDAGADVDPTHAQNILEALCAHLAGAPHLELEALAFLLVELIPQVGERLLGDIERVRLFLDQLQLLDARPHVLRQFL